MDIYSRFSLYICVIQMSIHTRVTDLLLEKETTYIYSTEFFYGDYQPSKYHKTAADPGAPTLAKLGAQETHSPSQSKFRQKLCQIIDVPPLPQGNPGTATGQDSRPYPLPQAPLERMALSPTQFLDPPLEDLPQIF